MNNDLNLILEAWIHAGIKLGVRVEAPYYAFTIDGMKVPCVAHLPDFGSSNGMLIGLVLAPDFEVDKKIKDVARELKKYCTFINAKIYAKYDETVFKEALADWDFWGEEMNRPAWLQASR